MDLEDIHRVLALMGARRRSTTSFPPFTTGRHQHPRRRSSWQS
jgi:hypothetical protein